MKLLYILVLMLLLTSCVHSKWSTMDKALYTGVIIAQVADGITTQNWLAKNPHNYISPPWERKYGTQRPSPTRLWLVKTGELGLCYVVADQLPNSLRKLFLIGVGSLLTYYAVDNHKGGA
ncbi:MAG: hypothetical protein ACTSPI_14920, partial [Candidatus Heimdallarchaeaceae archaeon]